MPSAIPPSVREEIDEALRQDRKIEAIKILRAATGAGLKDAKEAVEAHLARGLADPPPGASSAAAGDGPGAPVGARDSAVRSTSGCGSVVALAVGSALAWIWWL